MSDDEFSRWLAERDPEADFAAAARVASELAPTLIGLDIATAKALVQERGLSLRVRGEGPAAWTLDRRPNRINLIVEQGHVASAEVY